MRALFEAIDAAPDWLVLVVEALTVIAFVWWTKKRSRA